MTRNQAPKKKAAMLEALRRSGGNISVACKSVGIPRKTHYKWLKDDEKYAEAVDEVTDEIGDYVESELIKQVRAHNLTAIIFYCKTKLKNRGYFEKGEIEHSGNLVIDVEDFEA